MRNYRKKREKRTYDVASLTADELIGVMKARRFTLSKKVLLVIPVALVVLPLLSFSLRHQEFENLDVAQMDSIQYATTPLSAAASKKDLISIPAGTVKANPFLPYRDISGSSVSDVPKYDLVAPPEVLNENSDAARVMDTIVSGILYDKFSPSAILNIEGNDYLVKKGDVVNNYRIINILQDSVTVKLGNNVYKAGIGEILTEGSVNHNDVSNLSKKFGGEKR